MVHGAHVILYSKDADADRAFFRDVLKYPFADAGHGWLIFALPPAELAFHPAEKSSHELYLMCDDVKAFVAEMEKKGIATSPLQEERWGILTQIHASERGQARRVRTEARLADRAAEEGGGEEAAGVQEESGEEEVGPEEEGALTTSSPNCQLPAGTASSPLEPPAPRWNCQLPARTASSPLEPPAPR